MSSLRTAQPGERPLQRRGQRQHCSPSHAVRGTGRRAAPSLQPASSLPGAAPCGMQQVAGLNAAQVLSNIAWTVLGSGGLHLPAVSVTVPCSPVQHASRSLPEVGGSAALPCSSAAAPMLNAAAFAVLTCTLLHYRSYMAVTLTSASAGRTAGSSGPTSGRGCRHFAPLPRSTVIGAGSPTVMLWRLCCSMATSQRLR